MGVLFGFLFVLIAVVVLSPFIGFKVIRHAVAVAADIITTVKNGDKITGKQWRSIIIAALLVFLTIKFFF